MSNPHPLNQAVIAQALHDLRNGQLRRAKSMGFEDADLDALKHPAMASVLANAPVSPVLCDSQSGCRATPAAPMGQCSKGNPCH